MTRQVTVRLPDGLERAARERKPELSTEPLTLLLRIGLAVLAGWSVDDARRILRGSRQHPIRMPDDETLQAEPGNRS